MNKNIAGIIFIIFSTFNHIFTIQVISVENLIKNHPEIVYKKCFDSFAYQFEPFPLNKLFLTKGNYQEAFVLEIPQGKTQGYGGFTLIDNCLIQETIRCHRNCLNFYRHIQPIPDNLYTKIPGTVAIVAQIFSANYYHALFDTLGRLALIEMNNIAYDYIYIPINSSYIKELLELWGIRPNQVISSVHIHGIQADTLLVPSELCNVIPQEMDNGAHVHPYTAQYIRYKLLTKLKNYPVNMKKLSKKVFISRKDAGMRKILNEDEIFAPLEKRGFVRYEISKLSVAEQIMLFHNADIIVGEHGAAFANIIFCKPTTKIIEITHNLPNNCFWWISQLFNLNYTIFPLTNIELDIFGEPINPKHDWHANFIAPVEKIDEIINLIE